MGKIWFYMISLGIIGSIFSNNLGELNKVILNEASKGIEFAISIAGLSPIMKRLFPSVPQGHKAMSYMVMNIALNMLGAGNGATAFGLKAMNELQTLNPKKDTASNDMIMFLVINISSVQIIPFTMLKVRMDMGAQNPSEIILTTLFATLVSTVVAITSCRLLRGRYK